MLPQCEKLVRESNGEVAQLNLANAGTNDKISLP